MPTAGLPRPQAAIVDRTGLPTREWYSYFLQLRDGSGLTPAQQQQLDDLAARVTALEDGGTGGGSIQGIGSIITQGAPPGIVQITLEGDTDEPGNTWYYGTGPDGTRGWYSLADGFAVTADLTKAVDGPTGVTTFGLADLSNSGIGAALVKITRDAKGRVGGTAAANTDDLPESGTPTNQWFTAARVRAAVLTGLSTATNVAITAADSILGALGKLQAQLSGISAGSLANISGLVLVYVSGTSLTVGTGSCYIQSLGRVVAFPSAITVSGLSLSASTFYHVFVYLNSSTPAAEVVTTAPAATYFGDARSKTGDTSRRYIGSILTDASGAIIRFVMTAQGAVGYTNPGTGATPFRVLANKQTAAEVSVSLSSVVPATANSVTVRQFFNRTVTDNASSLGPASGQYWNNVSSPGVGFLTFPLLSQAIYAKLNNDIVDGNGGLFVDVEGYTLAR